MMFSTSALRIFSSKKNNYGSATTPPAVLVVPLPPPQQQEQEQLPPPLVAVSSSSSSSRTCSTSSSQSSSEKEPEDDSNENVPQMKIMKQPRSEDDPPQSLDLATTSTSTIATTTTTTTSIWGIVYIMLGSFSFSIMFLLVKLMKGTSTFTLVYYRSWVQILLSLLALTHAWRKKQREQQERKKNKRQEQEIAWLLRTNDHDHDEETAEQNKEAFALLSKDYHNNNNDDRTTSGHDDDDIWSFFLGPAPVRGWLVWRGLSGAAAVCAFFFGIQILPLPDAVTLQFTTPPFAALFAVALVGEPWLPLDKLGAVVCLLGVVLIAHPTVLFGNPTSTTGQGVVVVPDDDDDHATEQAMSSSGVWMQSLAVLVCTGGAALAGMAYVTVRKIGNRTSPAVMVLYYGILSLPLTVLGSCLWEGTWRVWIKQQQQQNTMSAEQDLVTTMNTTTASTSFTALDWLYLMLMGVAGYGGQWWTNLGLQQETAAKATLATSTQIVWTYIFELTLLHESLQGWSVAGTALILGYMLLVACVKWVQQQRHQQEQKHNQQDSLTHKNKTIPEEEELLLA
ncbi:hypothetical protein ACA910_008829 [Epithemia clementina (nom. ined.)]